MLDQGALSNIVHVYKIVKEMLNKLNVKSTLSDSCEVVEFMR